MALLIGNYSQYGATDGETKRSTKIPYEAKVGR